MIGEKPSSYAQKYIESLNDCETVEQFKDAFIKAAENADKMSETIEVMLVTFNTLFGLFDIHHNALDALMTEKVEQKKKKNPPFYINTPKNKSGLDLV
jgi:hypothetical protein